MEKQKKGFACLTPERRAEIARMGGKSVPAEKRHYSIDRSSASAAGVKGGAWSRKKAVTDRESEQ
jgi:general stress protein YciG